MRDEVGLRPRSILPSRPGAAALLLLLGGLTLIAVSGCSGCTSGSQAKKDKDKEKEQEKPKEDFDVQRLRVLPNDATSAIHNAVKPNHYTSVTQRITANNYDYSARIDSASVNRNGRPVRIKATPYMMLSGRPAPLPKGQTKNFEMTYFIPAMDESRASWLHARLRSRRGARELAEGMQPTTTMPAYQYYLTILAAQPNRYLAYKRLDSVMPPGNEFDARDDIVYYRVVIPKVDRGAPLPSQTLAWTSTAVLMWDEMDPTALTPGQQDSLLDWLHFGGQLIISGPASMDLLKGSFLEPYLPVEKVETVELKQSDFDKINAYWSLTNRKKNEKASIDIEKPLVGVKLKPKGSGVELPETGGLAYERQIGRGRIVVTGFSLKDRKILNWGSFDGFFHNCLLRRPARQFVDAAEGVVMTYLRYGANSEDARLVSAFRLFARDVSSVKQGQPLSVQQRQDNRRIKGDTWRFGGFSSWDLSGVGGWNDESGAAMEARSALKEAAGISIPPADFVFKVVVVYLLFLVPINWIVFRLMGRVELAWVAAPVIAIIGSIAVVKLAQLDIGFARSRTEAAVLELHAGHNRGHLTRYSALYTSLSTTYDFLYEDQTAQAQPFPSDLSYEPGIHDKIYTVSFLREKQVTLSGFTVPSNSTGMVHSEQMFSLQGPIRVKGDAKQGFQLENNSELTLQDVMVLRALENGQVEVAMLPKAQAKTAQSLSFEPHTEGSLTRKWSDSPIMGAGNAPAGEVSLAGLALLAVEVLELAPGEMRLVGWTSEELKGTKIRPAASQSLLRTLVLVHLTPPRLPPIRRDRNLHAEVADDSRALKDGDFNPFQGANP